MGLPQMVSFELDEVPKQLQLLWCWLHRRLRLLVFSIYGVIHLFVRKDRPLRTFDKDIVDVLVDEMAKSGPTLHTHANASRGSEECR